MIAFFSNEHDISSKKILEWLIKFKQDVLIVNRKGSHFIDIDKIDKNDLILNINGAIINSNKISSVYFRRSIKATKLTLQLPNTASHKKTMYQQSLISYITSNEITKGEILNKYLSSKITFGGENKGRINKYIALTAAKKVGMEIPETILTNSKEKLILFKEKHRKVICKSMNIGFYYSDAKYKYGSYTNLINNNDLQQIPEKFGLTLFQQYIEKDFEIRCFCFNKYFYSVAYFSQNRKKTKIDYRKHDGGNPFRQVPINIPSILKQKIKFLFKELGLTTGSIDIISRNGKYYFLEVNPVGIFDNVSFFGNWYIERDIANFLIYGK